MFRGGRGPRRTRSFDDSTRDPFRRITDLLNDLDPADGPTPYELLEPAALRRSHDPGHEAELPKMHHWQEAVIALERYNDPDTPLNDRAKAALRRLQALGRLDRWYGDIFLKICLDIDDLFFNRNLRNNVCFRWTCEPQRAALAYCAGPGLRQCRRVSINFNVPHLVVPILDVHEALMVVIHEMIHAYTMTHCDGARDLDAATVDRRKFEDKGMHPSRYQALAHGVSFTRCLKAIQGRVGPTRNLYMAHLAGQPGGTVAIGTPLRDLWQGYGGFNTEDEFQAKQLIDWGPTPPMPTRAANDEARIEAYLASNPWANGGRGRGGGPRGRGFPAQVSFHGGRGFPGRGGMGYPLRRSSFGEPYGHGQPFP